MIKSTIMTVDLEHPARWCSMYDSFPHWKVTLSFLSLHTVPSGKEPTVCSSNHPSGWSTYINYLKTFHTCPSCVNVFHHFCVSLTNSRTFIFFLGFFSAVLGLLCFAFLWCGKQGLRFIAVHGLFIAVASLVAEHGLWAGGLQQLQLAGPRA